MFIKITVTVQFTGVKTAGSCTCYWRSYLVKNSHIHRDCQPTSLEQGKHYYIRGGSAIMEIINFLPFTELQKYTWLKTAHH